MSSSIGYLSPILPSMDEDLFLVGFLATWLCTFMLSLTAGSIRCIVLLAANVVSLPPDLRETIIIGGLGYRKRDTHGGLTLRVVEYFISIRPVSEGADYMLKIHYNILSTINIRHADIYDSCMDFLQGLIASVDPKSPKSMDHFTSTVNHSLSLLTLLRFLAKPNASQQLLQEISV
ncbi:hypothetical protein M5K25_009110 [Dendrobium thyrsiflorum]|uniref:Uncharacterized protein n=1 Tax=Dendrobium thyrsiflorum TaxID=117978 RepID=A0ABD0V4Z3_DENTH